MPQPKQSPAKSRPAAKKKPAARKPAAKAPAPVAKRPVAQAAPGDAEAAALRDEALRTNISQLRDLLAGGVVLTAQRVQEAMDDAVARGRLTRDDAEQLVQGLVTTGRQQAFDLMAEVENLFDRGRTDLDDAARKVRDTAVKSGDKALRGADKVRRVAKIPSPSGFPIAGYDDLTAAAIAERLEDLGPAELRKVRDYEARNANRKSVLAKLDKALG